MSRREGASEPSRRGRTFLDLFLGAALVAILGATVAPLFGSADRREALRVACAEARSLHAAFRRYHEKNQDYPTANPKDGSDVLEPLRRRGYYTGEITQYLKDGRLDAYDTQEQEHGAEYWLEMTLASDPSLRLLVARSDDAPIGHGNWLDGAYLLRDGKLEPL